MPQRLCDQTQTVKGAGQLHARGCHHPQRSFTGVKSDEVFHPVLDLSVGPAPMRVAATTPSINSIVVGSPRTPNPEFLLDLNDADRHSGVRLFLNSVECRGHSTGGAAPGLSGDSVN